MNRAEQFLLLAGCRFSWGHPISGKTQPMSMIVLLSGIDYKQLTVTEFDALIASGDYPNRLREVQGCNQAKRR